MRRSLDDKKLSKDVREEIVEMVLAVYSGGYKPSEGAGKLNDFGVVITPEELQENVDILKDRINGVVMSDVMTNFQTKLVLHYLMVHGQGEYINVLRDTAGKLTYKQDKMYAEANLDHATMRLDIIMDQKDDYDK